MLLNKGGLRKPYLSTWVDKSCTFVSFQADGSDFDGNLKQTFKTGSSSIVIIKRKSVDAMPYAGNQGGF